MPPFQYDVFISYRHLDNQSGWVDDFHERLRIRLTELLGRPAEIWRDKKKLEGHDFADEIKDSLERSKVFISIMSPGYVNAGSDWCINELRTFFKLAKRNGNLRVGNKPRIVKAVMTPVPREKYPQEVQASNDFMFYDVDPDSKRPLFFSQGSTSPLYRKYLDKVDEVAWYIQGLLGEIDKLAEIGRTVYLAETTSDLKGERERIRCELEDHGYRVLPDEELPREAPDYQDAVRDNLKLACLSIHLIGAKYGPYSIPDGEQDKAVVILQNELAAERS